MPLKQIMFLKILCSGGWLVAAALSRKSLDILCLMFALRQLMVTTMHRHIFGRVKVTPLNVVASIVETFSSQRKATSNSPTFALSHRWKTVTMIKSHSQARSFRHGLTMSLSCTKSLGLLLALVFLFLVSVGCVYGNAFYTDHNFKPLHISGFSRGKIDVFELTWFKWPLSLAIPGVNFSFWLMVYKCCIIYHRY